MRTLAPEVTRGDRAAVLLRALTIASGVALVSCRSSSEPTPTVGTRAEPLVPAPGGRGKAPETQPERAAAKVPAPAANPASIRKVAAAEASLEDDWNERKSFRLEGVRDSDVLNIRSEPDAESYSSGSIPAGTTNVEGLGPAKTVGSTTWQRVRHAGVVGWVNARFLALNAGGAPPQAPPPAKIEALTPLVCFGNEPHWSLRFGPDGTATCGGTCDAPPGLRVTKILARDGNPAGFDLLDARGKLWLSVVVGKTDECSDGMSDDPYPYELRGTGASVSLSGCCRIKTPDEN
jgi:uncharacterized membrane protein